MRFALLHLERNFYDRVQRSDFLEREVAPGVKDQAIDSGEKVCALRQQLRATTLLIGTP